MEIVIRLKASTVKGVSKNSVIVKLDSLVIVGSIQGIELTAILEQSNINIEDLNNFDIELYNSESSNKTLVDTKVFEYLLATHTNTNIVKNSHLEFKRKVEYVLNDSNPLEHYEELVENLHKDLTIASELEDTIYKMQRNLL